MNALSSLAGGFAGACALTIIHQSVKEVVPQAPRMDLLGMDALSKVIKSTGHTPPKKNQLYNITLTGDVVSNALYYSLAGIGNEKGAWVRGALLGLGAGLGAVLLPEPLGLKEAPSNRTTETKVMTVALYLIGGLVATAVTKWLNNKDKNKRALQDESVWSYQY